MQNDGHNPYPDAVAWLELATQAVYSAITQDEWDRFNASIPLDRPLQEKLWRMMLEIKKFTSSANVVYKDTVLKFRSSDDRVEAAWPKAMGSLSSRDAKVFPSIEASGSPSVWIDNLTSNWSTVFPFSRIPGVEKDDVASEAAAYLLAEPPEVVGGGVLLFAGDRATIAQLVHHVTSDKAPEVCFSSHTWVLDHDLANLVWNCSKSTGGAYSIDSWQLLVATGLAPQDDEATSLRAKVLDLDRNMTAEQQAHVRRLFIGVPRFVTTEPLEQKEWRTAVTEHFMNSAVSNAFGDDLAEHGEHKRCKCGAPFDALTGEGSALTWEHEPCSRRPQWLLSRAAAITGRSVGTRGITTSPTAWFCSRAIVPRKIAGKWWALSLPNMASAWVGLKTVDKPKVREIADLLLPAQLLAKLIYIVPDEEAFLMASRVVRTALTGLQVDLRQEFFNYLTLDEACQHALPSVVSVLTFPSIAMRLYGDLPWIHAWLPLFDGYLHSLSSYHPGTFPGMLDLFLPDEEGPAWSKIVSKAGVSYALHGLWHHLSHEKRKRQYTDKEVQAFVDGLPPELQHVFPARPSHELAEHAGGEGAKAFAAETCQAWSTVLGGSVPVARISLRNLDAQDRCYVVNEIGFSCSWPRFELSGVRKGEDIGPVNILSSGEAVSTTFEDLRQFKVTSKEFLPVLGTLQSSKIVTGVLGGVEKELGTAPPMRAAIVYARNSEVSAPRELFLQVTGRAPSLELVIPGGTAVYTPGSKFAVVETPPGGEALACATLRSSGLVPVIKLFNFTEAQEPQQMHSSLQTSSYSAAFTDFKAELEAQLISGAKAALRPVAGCVDLKGYRGSTALVFDSASSNGIEEARELRVDKFAERMVTGLKSSERVITSYNPVVAKRRAQALLELAQRSRPFFKTSIVDAAVKGAVTKDLGGKTWEDPLRYLSCW